MKKNFNAIVNLIIALGILIELVRVLVISDTQPDNKTCLLLLIGTIIVFTRKSNDV